MKKGLISLVSFIVILVSTYLLDGSIFADILSSSSLLTYFVISIIFSIIWIVSFTMWVWYRLKNSPVVAW